MEKPENISLNVDGTAVILLDQTMLPGEPVYLELNRPEELFDAIKSLRVRGAPAIGIFAAYAIYVLALRADKTDIRTFAAKVISDSNMLGAARPTAVNLTKQLQRMTSMVNNCDYRTVPQILEAMRKEAEAIQWEDILMCRTISEYGLSLIGDNSGIMTYCNAGPLATSLYGTALGPILLANERGTNLRVFCCETRPLLQGARLTAYELNQAGIDCTLICDNMASIVMKEGKIDAVFVGCRRKNRRCICRVRQACAQRRCCKQDRNERCRNSGEALQNTVLCLLSVVYV